MSLENKLFNIMSNDVMEMKRQLLRAGFTREYILKIEEDCFDMSKELIFQENAQAQAIYMLNAMYEKYGTILKTECYDFEVTDL